MEIKGVEIHNFRSIQKIELPFDEISGKKSSILLWINESGKSNILKAISLLNQDNLKEIKYVTDCHKLSEKKKEKIKIIFNLKILNFEFYKKKYIESGIPKKIVDQIEIQYIKRLITVDSTDSMNNYYNIWINEGVVYDGYLMDSANKIVESSAVYSGTEKLTEENIEKQVGVGYSLLNKDSLEEILETDFFSLYEHNIPEVIFWEYSDEYLINNEIPLNDFKNNYNLSKPLKNIFNIAWISDIKWEIEQIESSREKKKQLEEALSENITTHINQLWKEHKINIIIDIDSMVCTIMVEDKDNSLPKYSMNQRSDWFKQFISILLNLSAQYSSKQLKNKIILLDEPEVHLHPSWIRYLRDELLKISKENTVVISTHSIYMVDREDLWRHYKVEKEESLTSITRIPSDNPYMEEVIYEALWTSVYEIVEPNMIVFEWKTDKDIFDTFLWKYKVDLKPKNLASISADWVQKIPTYMKFFNWKYVVGYVLVDSDSDGRWVKKIVEKTNKHTYEINDIYDTWKDSTLEDLLPKELIEEIILKYYSVNIELDITIPFIHQINIENRKLQWKINTELLKGYIANEVIKDISKLTKDKCKEKYTIYYSFLSKFVKKIK